MKEKYETLDEYLNDLDAIKEKIADKTKGMTTKQVKVYFAQTTKRLRELMGQKLRLRHVRHKKSPLK
jgi:hypothetical protein